MQISDRCFLITGGGSGLGAASARMLVDAGARVVLADVNAAAGQQTAAALGEAARFVHCDVTREEDGKAAVSAARQHGGILHGLNDGGIGMAQYCRAPGTHVVDVFIPVHIPHMRTHRAFSKERLTAHTAKGAHRRIHPTRNVLQRFSKQRLGFGSWNHERQSLEGGR